MPSPQLLAELEQGAAAGSVRGERMSGERGAHTPGTWTVAQDTLDGRLSFPVIDAQGRHIASACALDLVKVGYGKEEDARTHSAVGQVEAWANAHLIAKAPRMAALLDEVVEVLESVEWGDFDGHENRCPECDGREKHGHRSDCRLSALLSRLKREEGGE